MKVVEGMKWCVFFDMSFIRYREFIEEEFIEDELIENGIYRAGIYRGGIYRGRNL